MPCLHYLRAFPPELTTKDQQKQQERLENLSIFYFKITFSFPNAKRNFCIICKLPAHHKLRGAKRGFQPAVKHNTTGTSPGC